MIFKLTPSSLKKILLFIIIVISVKPVFSQNYDKFIYVPDQDMYIETVINSSVMVNGFVTGQNQSAEKTIERIKSINKNGSAILSCETFIIDSTNYNNGKYNKLSKHLTYETEKSPDGKTNKKYERWGLYDFPRLPMKEMKTGEAYETDSVYRIPLFNTNLPDLNLDVRFVNRFLGTEKMPDGDILSTYSARGIIHKESCKATLNNANIFKIVGFTDNSIKFNRTKGSVYSIEEYFDWTFILYDMTIVEVSGTSITYFKTPPPVSLDVLEKMLNNSMDSNEVRMNRDLQLTISIENVGFKADSAELTDPEKIRIGAIAKNLMENGVTKMIIKGHTADVGSKDKQLALSESRAKAVLDYLCEKYGFKKENLSFSGVGGKEPVDSNLTEEGRSRNRRVEFILLPE